MTDTIHPAELLRATGDYTEVKKDGTGGGMFAILGPAAMNWGGLLAGVAGSNGLPAPYTRQRDLILANAQYIEGMWASALSIAVSKIVAQGYTLEDETESARRINAARRIIQGFDGWWFNGIQRNAQDYLTTNNGAHIRIVFERGGGLRKVRGIVHLDSLHCYPTGDPAYPVMYYPWRGGGTLLSHEEVIRITDMPSPRVGAWNIGQCAADRAWEAILRLCAVQTYFREKVTGSRNLAIHFITNINAETLRNALANTESDQAQKGFVVYRGSPIIPMLGGVGGETPTLITIPLAEIPDGFDVTTERNNAHLVYSNAIGIALQELQPLSGQGLGTGTQSIIQAEEAEGRGMAAYKRALAAALTDRVMANSTSFAFAVNDVRDKKQAAEAAGATAGWVKTMVEVGALTPQAALNIMVDAGYVDRAYLPADQTPGTAVTDQDPTELPAPSEAPPAPPALPAPMPTQPATKAKRITPREIVISAEDVTAALELMGEGEV